MTSTDLVSTSLINNKKGIGTGYYACTEIGIMKNINEGWCIANNGYPVEDSEVKRYISVTPSERQLRFMEMKYYNFIHFGINTVNNREWGDGKEDISRFNPKKLDTDQWCRILKNTGSKGVIITAKHHDGFCLFDTAYTDHNVMNTPLGKDIVKMLSESCKKYGLKFGVYLSPWDRHEKTYGTEEYNDFFVGQLTELCINYGDIFCFWFDGACGEGKNGKKQVYDWERYYSVIRKHQPEAVITICGPDVRWIGNEGGKVRESEWSVIPDEKDSNDLIAENSQTDASQTKEMAEKLDERTDDLGSRQVLKNYERLVFKPAEADVSINHGWFHTNRIFSYARKGRTPEALAQIYFNTVGGNASMLLNVPPNRHGLIGRNEEKRLKKFTELINEPFKNEIRGFSLSALSVDGEKREITDGTMLKNDETGYVLALKKKRKISALSFCEDLKFSQRTEEFRVYIKDGKGEWAPVYEGTVIGSGKIVKLEKYALTDEVLIAVTQSRSNPVLRDFKIYANS